MYMMTAGFFVQFDNALKDEAIPKGYRKGLGYPVLAIKDVEWDGEKEGEIVDETYQYLADASGHFHWISDRLLVRMPPKKEFRH